ncbi:asn/thr-rich large protein family protein [Ectocarpus siliculosus]|uniref:Asn/thr-rich large protein family protein n=1 Tax=Ectocarpus siliculosus TaxID=2880 RepID=D7FL58_ECTSI|nr:asn/thr-rich large protein family protein [Ectocarpus siliculosus]|eukprot:CBJ29594.1 asn/thr-rich large protein family protein [Ectocarpus siliculosus]
MGTSEFSNNSVAVKQFGRISCGDGCTRSERGLTYIVKKGGAIHNKGTLTFDGDATFERNVAHTESSNQRGNGGAISNTGSGTILFKSKLTMKDNQADANFAGLGGAIYNRGEIIVEGASLFSLNHAAAGGGIHQTSIGTMTFNGMATFSENFAGEPTGGGLTNNGGVVNINAGSLFEHNWASASGDGGFGGAIFNTKGGVVTLMGSTTFRDNWAHWGGAIYTNDADGPGSVTTFPDDTVFEDNRAEYCPDVHNGDDDNCPVV